MADPVKTDENIERKDKPTVRFETVVEEPEETGVSEHKLDLPHRIPEETAANSSGTVPEMTEPVEVHVNTESQQTVTEEVQGTRFDELAKALGNGGVEAETEISTKKTSGRSFSWGWLVFFSIFVFGAGLGMAGGYAMWGNQFEIRTQTGKQTGDETPLIPNNAPNNAVINPTASPTPVVSFDRSTVSLQVLNGSGIPGAASDLKEELEELGYENVNAGNASNSDFEETKISVKNSKKTILEMLMSDISKSVEVSSTAGTLSETSNYDAIVTIGRN